MQRIDYPERKDWEKLLERPTQTVSDIEDTVVNIFEEIQIGGDSVSQKIHQTI